MNKLSGIAEQKRRLRQKAADKYEKTLPQEKLAMFLNQHLINVTLYMRHNCWKSQYAFNMLNYQELGFNKISDYTYLYQISYSFNLRHLKEDEKWPTLKFVRPVSEPQIITGREQIYEYLDNLGLIKYEVDMREIQALNQHINNKIIPSLDYIFLHPRLTFEEHFHLSPSTFQTNSINYTIVGTLARNFRKVVSHTTKNLIKIAQNRQKYEESRIIFKQSMKQLEYYFQSGEEFIGGDSISHMDLYLYSILCTKMQSLHFSKYLQQELGGPIWQWISRMKRSTAHNRQRMTVL